MPKMTVRQLLESGALESELERRIQNADDVYEKRDAQNALRIAKSWKATLARTKGIATRGMTKAVSLAVSIADIEAHELHSIAGMYHDEIVSGALEQEIQSRLLAAISGDNLPAQRTFAMGFVKARAARRILQTEAASASRKATPVTGPALGVTTFDMRQLAESIGPPQGLPAHLGGSVKPQDPWDEIARRILGPSYPKEYDAATADPASLQIKAGSADDLLKRQRDTLEVARSITASSLPKHLGGDLAKTGHELPAHFGGPKKD